MGLVESTFISECLNHETEPEPTPRFHFFLIPLVIAAKFITSCSQVLGSTPKILNGGFAWPSPGPTSCPQLGRFCIH